MITRALTAQFALLLLVLFCNSSAVSAKHDHHENHSIAPTFSDPAVLVEVPEGWEEKPIKHFAKHKDADLVVALGQQSYPLFHELIPEYGKARGLKIVVEPGTCGITSGRLLKKKVDIGTYCCPPGKNDRLPGLKFYSLGIAPIALIVNPRNPLQNVSTKQAIAIFDGEISHWSEVDPSNRQLIKPVGRLHCKTRPGHWRALINTEDEFSPRLFEVGVIPDMMSQVSRNASSIGWETPLMVDHHEKRGKVKMLNIDNHSPTDLEYVASGQYPLYRSYSLTAWTTKSKTNDEAVRLIQFLREYVETHYQEINFIPVSHLRKAGWKFEGEELVGEPDIAHKH